MKKIKSFIIVLLAFICIVFMLQNTNKSNVNAEEPNYIYAVSNTKETKLTLKNSKNIPVMWLYSETYDGNYEELNSVADTTFQMDATTELAAGGWVKIEGSDPIHIMNRTESNGKYYYDGIEFFGNTTGTFKNNHKWYVGNHINDVAYFLFEDDNPYEDHRFSIIGKYYDDTYVYWYTTSDYYWELRTTPDANPNPYSLDQESGENVLDDDKMNEYDSTGKLSSLYLYPFEGGLKFKVKMADTEKSLMLQNNVAFGDKQFSNGYNGNSNHFYRNPSLVAFTKETSQYYNSLNYLEAYLGGYDVNDTLESNMDNNTLRPALTVSSASDIDVFYIGPTLENHAVAPYDFNRDNNSETTVMNRFKNSGYVDVVYSAPHEEGDYDTGYIASSSLSTCWINRSPNTEIEFVINAGASQNIQPHDHSFTYVANNNTITATCNTTDCPIDSGLTLTLNAPESLVYDGNAKTATISSGYNSDAFPNPVIEYYKDNQKVNSCINAGDYEARVTIGNVTAKKSFTIAKADSVAPNIGTLNARYGQALSAIANQFPSNKWSWKDSTELVGNAGTRQHIAIYKESDNHNGVEVSVTIDVAKIDPEYEFITVNALLGTKVKDVELPQGWSWEGNTEKVLSTAGITTHYATFTPEDTDNYNIITEITVRINVISHLHNFTYTANGNKITASCTNEDCTIDEGLVLELLAPTGTLIYDGTEKIATIKTGYNSEAFPNIQIKYYKGETEVTSCKNVGIYVATVQFGDAIARVEFEIKSWELDDTEQNVKVLIDNVNTDENITLKVEVKLSLDSKETNIEAYDSNVKVLLDNDEEIVKVYDVKLYRTINGQKTEIQPSDIKDGTIITVVITLPLELRNKDLKILHVHSVDDVEVITVYEKKGNDLYFNVSRLSEFAFATKVTQEEENQTTTTTTTTTIVPTNSAEDNGHMPGGVIFLIVLIIIVAICVCFYLFIFFVFNKWIIIDNKIVRAFKFGKKDDEIRLFTLKFKKQFRDKEEVFKKKKEAEDYLKEKEKTE